MKQLFCLMLFCASMFIISCNKETADITNYISIETSKLSENSISLDEAKMTFAKAVKETHNSAAGDVPLNLADFDPQWSQSNGVNYVDTSGNMLTVPTASFQVGDTKNLCFFVTKGKRLF